MGIYYCELIFRPFDLLCSYCQSHRHIRLLEVIQSQALSTPFYDAASVRLLKPSTAITCMEVEESAAFAPSSPHLSSASPHRFCVGYIPTPTFLRARSAGDAALDRGG
jgi:hypothetical protein